MKSLFRLTGGNCDVREPHNFIPEMDLRYLIETALPRQIEYELKIQHAHEQGTCLMTEETRECSCKMYRRMCITLAELQQVYYEIQEVKAQEITI